MNTYDKDLAEIIKNHQAVEIAGKQYYVEPNPTGSCSGCAWENRRSCPDFAREMCTSNGGNILVRVKK